MKALVTTMLMALVAFAASNAIEAAYAQTNFAAPKPRVTVQPNARGTVRPNEVRAGSRIIGSDPDPFIRGEILRHRNSGWPD
jgi:hypothetical protein